MICQYFFYSATGKILVQFFIFREEAAKSCAAAPQQ